VIHVHWLIPAELEFPVDLLAGERHRFLLRDADKDHLVAHLSLLSNAIGDVVLSLSVLKLDDRDLMLLGILLESPHKVLRDLA
jgi:hypothetical protein